MSVTVISEDFVHYEVLGRGKPLVFIHGWLGSWRYWWTSMQSVSTEHRAFAYDLWGYGDSSKVESKYSFESYLDLLVQFIDRLGIAEPIILVGHDLGAAVALRYAKLYPDRVDRLVVVSMPINGGTIANQLTNGKLEAFLSRYLNKSNPFSELKQEFGKTDLTAVSVVARQLTHYDFTVDLKEVTCPVLMIFGERDVIIKNPNNGNGASFNTGSTCHVVVMEDCNHFPMLEEPAIFNRLLQDFIQNGDQEKVLPKVYWQRRTR